jgi:hypothetical protein
MKTSASPRSSVETDTSRRAVLAAQARSGLSVPDFAAARGLSPATLYAWRRRLGLTRPHHGRRLLEVAVAPPSVPRGGLVLHLFGRHRLELPPDVGDDELLRLLRLLSSC